MERCHFSCFFIGGAASWWFSKLATIFWSKAPVFHGFKVLQQLIVSCQGHGQPWKSQSELIQDNSNDLAGWKKTRWPLHKWHLGFEGWCLWLRFGKNLLFSAESLQKIFSGWVLFCKPTDPIYLGSNVILSASFTWQWFISQPREHIFEWEHMGKSSVIIIIILWVSSHPGHRKRARKIGIHKVTSTGAMLRICRGGWSCSEDV